MIFTVKKIDRDVWIKEMSDLAHLDAFGETRQYGERIDFALLFVDREQDKPAGYVTAVEMDSETLYVQYGGVFSKYRKSIYPIQIIEAGLEWVFSQYKRLATRVENTNSAMLKIYLKLGFLIIGTRTFKNKIYLELLKEPI